MLSPEPEGIMKNELLSENMQKKEGNSAANSSYHPLSDPSVMQLD